MSLVLRPLREGEVADAVAIWRDSFRTFLNVPDRMLGDADFVGPRFHIDPEAVIAAEYEGQLVGTNLVSHWGSVAVLGPVSVKPRGWSGGAGKALHEAAQTLAEAWGARLQVGFTFPTSPPHLDFYIKTGMWPRFLTTLIQRPLKPGSPLHTSPDWRRFSELDEGARAAALEEMRALTDQIYEGLDLSRQILGVHRLGLGETVLVHEGSRLIGMALCHLGAGTEAGRNTCYIKFAAARPGPTASNTLDQVLEAVTALALSRGHTRLTSGVNTARRAAYTQLTASGFQPTFIGVALHRPDDDGYNRPDAFVMDDWR